MLLLPPARPEETRVMPQAEPHLFRTSLRLEPSLRQVATMPIAIAEWRLAPTIASRFEAVVSAAGFSESLAGALRSRLALHPESGEGTIIPDPALLDRFSEAERLRWWAVLGVRTANRAQCWPVAIRASELAIMEQRPEFTEAVRRVRRWGVREGPRVIFADLFALEDAFANGTIRAEFYQQLLSADTAFVNLKSDTVDPAAISAQASYWLSRGRSRAVEPMIAAAGRIKEQNRIDVVHLLPRLARALLYTYPPDFSRTWDPAQDNAVLAAGFFAPEFDPQSVMEPGLAAWLRDHCDVVSGPRDFGDILVFEDPARIRTPYSLVYVADGILFGRRPSIYGPWEFLTAEEVYQLNPRLRGKGMIVYRPRVPRQTSTTYPRWLSPAWLAPAELKSLPAGKWGNLKYYDMLLAPSSELLENLAIPSAEPIWVFRGLAADTIRLVIDETPMSDGVRMELKALFAGVQPDQNGLIKVRPSLELVLATPPTIRERLFPWLEHGLMASDYAQLVRIPTQVEAPRWFNPELLPERARDVVLRLVYPRQGGLALSDFGALFAALPDPDEREAALRALYRGPAVILLLERPLPEEISGLVDYWRLDQTSSIRRLLQSFAANRDLAHLDIVHLLPPVARELLNVYMLAAANVPTPSCYWTAMNFDAERPDERFLVTANRGSRPDELVWRKLEENYETVSPAAHFGDIIVYRRQADGFMAHICTYVAADIVYTKNGLGLSNPWSLMHLADVDAIYSVKGITERVVYRLRSMPRTGK